MTEIKAFVRPDNTATIICPVCKTTKQVSAAPYLNKKHSIKIRCTCGTTFTVQFDFRHHYRKQISLRGFYRMVDPPRAGLDEGTIALISKINNIIYILYDTIPHYFFRIQ